MDKFSKKTIELAYREDVGSGDITSRATVPGSLTGKAIIRAKSPGVLSGIDAFIFAMRLSSLKIRVLFYQKDGQKFVPGDKIAVVTGPARAILRGERLALNLLSHLSGVATMTAEFVGKIKGTKAMILDTRKTTPGLRRLEKQAVIHGGGQNHRLGLYDMILIKDNHIDAAGGVSKALQKVNKRNCKVEIEVGDFVQLREALRFDPDIIMLDNFSVRDLRRAVRMIRRNKPKIKIEVSGGVDLKRVGSIARTGVDYISVGALTHSTMAADFSMRYVK